MNDDALHVDRLAKRYRLGVLTARTLKADVQRWWHRVRGRPDPLTRVTDLGDPTRPSGPAAAPGGQIWALRDVSFSVRRGEVVGIIGRNGAGKSTLLKILSRITAPTCGEARLRGRMASLLEVGIGFHPELTGGENIFLNGAILGLSRAETRERMDRIVEFSGLARFLDTPVKRYSSGMYVRLAFAVAAHLDPEILLVDEVLAVGDVEFQRKCLGTMSRVAESGRTVLFVSHNLTAVSNLCPRCLVLDGGRLVFDGATPEAIERYMNLLEHAPDGASPGLFDLSGHVNPCGAGRRFATGMVLRDGAGAPRSRFRMGDPLRIDVQASGLGRIPSSVLGVIIKSEFGQWLCSLNTAMRCDPVGPTRAEEETVSLHVPVLRLTPGRYTVEIQVAQQGSRLIDRVESAGSFEVLDADVHGSGYRVTARDGVFFLDGHFTIRNACGPDS